MPVKQQAATIQPHGNKNRGTGEGKREMREKGKVEGTGREENHREEDTKDKERK